MTDLPTCPKCGSLGIGERCGQCGAAMPKREVMASIAAPGLELELDPAAVTPATPGGRPGGGPLARSREAAVYLQLQPSEQAVLHAASRILAGFAAAGTLTPENEQELADRAVRMAARMAVVIERYVQSDDEDW
jgi:hypothetical protein